MKKGTYAIFANDHYGLYAGLLESYDPQTRVAEVLRCRHVFRWYGRPGGISSLAASGICGPEASKSRIGEPCPSATLTGIVNVFACSDQAKESIEARGAEHESG